MKPLPPRRLRGLFQVVADGEGQNLGERALQAGLLTPEQLQACEQDAIARPGVPFRTILQERLNFAAPTLDVLELLGNQATGARTLASRYQLGPELGRGAMGVIYRATDLHLTRTVAVKFLRADRAISPNVIARVRREAQAVARLNHPNIPTLHDVGEVGGLPYIVMELVEGPTLADRAGGKPMAEAEAVAIIEKVARAIHHAHAEGVVHRDIKPANIKLDPTGEPRLLDFGLAHFTAGGEDLTRSGAAVGTPFYMAPEQVRGTPHAIDARTDVYGLGVTLFELVAGRVPHTASNAMEIFTRILNEDAPAVRTINPRISEGLERVLRKALEKDPNRRYGSALDFADDLQRLERGEPIQARSSNLLSRAWRRVRRKPMTLTLSVLAIGALVGTAVTAVILAKNKSSVSDRLEISELALELSEAYHELSSGTADAMRSLEDDWHNNRTGSETALATVKKVVDRAMGRYHRTSLPGAWWGLALHLAGRTEGMDILESVSAKATDDPFPKILLARGLMAGYARSTSLITLEWSPMKALLTAPR